MWTSDKNVNMYKSNLYSNEHYLSSSENKARNKS